MIYFPSGLVLKINRIQFFFHSLCLKRKPGFLSRGRVKKALQDFVGGDYRGVWPGSARLEHQLPKPRKMQAVMVSEKSQDKTPPPHGVAGWPKGASGLKGKDHLTPSSPGLRG